MTLTPKQFYQVTKPSRTLDIQNENDVPFYIDFSPVRGGQIIDNLIDMIAWSEPGKYTCILFTGHIGCGKSTELLRLKKELEDQKFHTLYFESDRDLDMGDLDISDILLTIARRVSQSVESVKNEAHAQSFRKLMRKGVDLLQKEVKLLIKANYFAIPGVGEFEFDRDLEDANLTLSTVIGKITATTKKNNDLKARLRDYLEPKIKAVIDVLNEALFDPVNAELQRQDKSGLAIIVDNLDRIHNTVKLSGKLQSEYIFGDRGADLNRLHCHVVYTIPLALRYTNSYKLVKERFKTLPVVLPMVPTHHRDGRMHLEGMALLQQMVLARAFPQLTPSERLEKVTTIFDRQETLEHLCKISGGHVRNLLRMLNPWIIAEKNFPLTRKGLEAVILNERNEEVQNITTEEWALLRQVRNKKDLVGDCSYDQLIGNLSVYEYRDDVGSWYDINPVLFDTIYIQNEITIKIEKFIKNINVQFEHKDDILQINSASAIRLRANVPFCLKFIDSPNQDNINEFIKKSKKIFQHLEKDNNIGIIIYKDFENPQDFSLNILHASLKQHFVIIPIRLIEIEQGLTDSQIAKGIIDEATRKYLTEKDFFADSHPIGDTLSFFGRQKTLQTLEKNLKNLQGVGIFGLRKSGKTSLILQLKLLLSDFPCVHIDLQKYNSKSYYGAAIFNEILEQLQKLLKKNNITNDLGEKFNEDQSTSEFTTIFLNKIEKLCDLLEKQVGLKMPIMCFFDEIERILPTEFDDSTIAQTKINEFNSFFGTLRVLNQKTRKVSILVADLHPDCNRINYWHKSNTTNPVYRFFKEIFLAPFSEKDTIDMISQMSILMGVKFEESLIKRIHKIGGGHPFWVRQVASLVWKKSQKIKQNNFQLIQNSAAQRFLDDIFSYSNLDEDLEQNLWIPLQNRKDYNIPEAIGAIPILNLLACNNQSEKGVTKQVLLKRLSKTCNISELKKALKWLELVGLITRYELKDDDSYKIHVLLLSTWLLENMKQEEINQWQL